jgi:orotidine-5'-phosphate decarboxylase
MSNPSAIANPVFCAIDTPDLTAAQKLVTDLGGAAGGIKLGKEFFTAHGPAGIHQTRDAAGVPLFLDLKFHDIPNTVAGAVRIACTMKPYMMTIHSSGGPAMIKAAADAATSGAEETSLMRPLIIAVTVLTSLDQADLNAVGITASPADQVRRLGALAQQNGADGIVCSPLEIEVLRKDLGPDFVLVVPGIRPAGTDAGDQKRVMTPEEAMQAGASHLVIGRPITQAPDPAAAARAIADSLSSIGHA